MIVELIARHWELLDALGVVVGLIVYVTASHALHQRRHPSAAIAWVMGIVLLPFLALPLYLAFGTRKIALRRPASEPIRNVPSPARHTTAAQAQRLAQAMALPDPASYEDLTIHADGAQALAALRRLIDGATETLDICTFLFGHDALGDEIGERLKQRAREGVRVRLLVDGVGVYMGGGLPDLQSFRAAGVEAQVFVSLFRSSRQGRTNLRNHRKMAIADGRHFWCGGRNLAAEYFVGDPGLRMRRRRRDAWLDLSFDVCGDLARQARQLFEQDWAFASESPPPEKASPEPALPAGPPPSVPGLAQLVASGPDRTDDTIHTLLISGCFTSRRRILAVTPYFVPDPVLLNAMSLAARRGVTVDLVIPARSNHRLADFVRHRALRDLAAAGGRVWLHPGMVHAKAVVVDDEMALAGSANLDSRSLFINYELMVAFYDNAAVHGFARWVEARRAEAVAYVAQRPGMAREVAEGVLLWLAFQL